MKLNFDYYGETFKIKVPKALIFINDLLEISDSEEDVWTETYDFLVEEMCSIFAKERGLVLESLYAEFMQPRKGDKWGFRVQITEFLKGDDGYYSELREK